MLRSMPPSGRSCLRRRPGSVALALLLLLPVLLLTVALVIMGGQLLDARTDLQTSADAAALAAVQVFVDDRVLLGKRQDMLELVAEARAEAWAYGQANPVLGQGLDVYANPTNDPA